jgi:hypothetical protein
MQIAAGNHFIPCHCSKESSKKDLGGTKTGALYRMTGISNKASKPKIPV